MAFRSPFRSPRPSCANLDDPKKTPNAESSQNVDVHHYNSSSKNIDGNIVRDLKSRTPQKLLLNKETYNNITPQRVTSNRHDYRKKALSQRFNSPFRSPCNKLLQQQQSETPENQLEDIIKQEADLDKEIAVLKESGFQVEELQGHIDNLHRYNEIKDAAQIVLGRLAELEQVTLKEIYEKYKIPESE